MVSFTRYLNLQLPVQDPTHLREALWLCQASHGFYSRAAACVESRNYSALFAQCATLRRAMAEQLAALVSEPSTEINLLSTDQPLVRWFEYSNLRLAQDTGETVIDGPALGMTERTAMELIQLEAVVCRKLTATTRALPDRVVRNRLSAQLALMQLLRDKLKRLEQSSSTRQ